MQIVFAIVFFLKLGVRDCFCTNFLNVEVLFCRIFDFNYMELLLLFYQSKWPISMLSSQNCLQLQTT